MGITGVAVAVVIAMALGIILGYHFGGTLKTIIADLKKDSALVHTKLDDLLKAANQKVSVAENSSRTIAGDITSDVLKTEQKVTNLEASIKRL